MVYFIDRSLAKTGIKKSLVPVLKMIPYKIEWLRNVPEKG